MVSSISMLSLIISDSVLQRNLWQILYLHIDPGFAIEQNTGLPVSFEEKKRFLKRLIFAEKKLKKGFQSLDLAMKICRKMQRYSLWSGLITSGQGFSQRFVFLSFFFLLEIFCYGQDGTKWCDALHRNVCGGCERASHATAGGPGVRPGKFFANISSEKGILGQI